jgi:acetyl/propionyl-CoA carboxylase alpha subunit
VPAGPGIRDDSGAEAGADVPIFYDPMISKLVAWGEDRPQAIGRMRRALREYDVQGIKTTVPFFRWMLEQQDFVEGRFHTAYLDEILRSRAGEPFTAPDEDRVEIAVIAAAIEHSSRVQKDPAYTDSDANRPTGSSVGRARSNPPNQSRASLWKARARAEGLRG